MISSHHGDDSLLHQNKKGGTLFTTYTTLQNTLV